MPGEYVDYAEALSLLGVSDQEFQSLVMAGKLRAYRAGGMMKFKQADVASLRGAQTEPTILMPSAPMVASPTAAMGPLHAAPQAAGGELGTEEVVFDDSDLEILPLDTGEPMSTSEITIQDEGTARTEDLGAGTEALVLEPESAAPPAASSRRMTARASGAPPVSRRISAAYEIQGTSPVWAMLLLLGAASLLFTSSVFTVVLWKGYYDDTHHQQFVPTYLHAMYDAVVDWGKPPSEPAAPLYKEGLAQKPLEKKPEASGETEGGASGGAPEKAKEAGAPDAGGGAGPGTGAGGGEGKT